MANPQIPPNFLKNVQAAPLGANAAAAAGVKIDEGSQEKVPSPGIGVQSSAQTHVLAGIKAPKSEREVMRDVPKAGPGEIVFRSYRRGCSVAFSTPEGGARRQQFLAGDGYFYITKDADEIRQLRDIQKSSGIIQEVK